MLAVKLIGAVLIGISGVVMSISTRRFQLRKLSTVDGFISLLFYIKGQIDCFSRPRSEILQSLPAEVFCACNCPAGAETLEELVEASRIYLDEETLRLMSSFASEFGSTFKDEQLRRCDYYIGAMSEERKKLLVSASAKTRSGGALWIFACLGIVILFW